MYTKEEQKQIANTIIMQMGGQGKLRAMVGANNFGFEQTDEGVAMSFHFKGSRKHNICKVILNGDDTYTFKLYKLNRRTYTLKDTYQLTGVYWDMLKPVFEQQTGLYLSL